MTRLFLVPIVFSVFFGSMESFGQRIQITPIVGAGVDGSSVTLSFQIPCDSKYVGLAVRQKGDLTEVGAAYLLRSTRCSGLSGIQKISVPWIHPQVIHNIVPMHLPWVKGRWKTAPVNMMQGLKNQAHRKKKSRVPPPRDLNLVHLSSCAQNINPGSVASAETPQTSTSVALIRLAHPRGEAHKSRTLEIGALEFSPRKEQKGCIMGEKTLRLRRLLRGPKGAGLLLQGLTLKPKGKANRTYRLRLAEIVPGSLRSDSKGITADYIRKCNEAPVGLVVRRPTIRKVGVGMLVAEYTDHGCEVANPEEPVRSRVRERYLSLPRRAQIYRIKPKARESLWLRTPQVGRSIKYESACRRHVGTVVVSTPDEGVGLGSLEREVAGEECSTPLRKVSIRRLPVLRPAAKKLSIAPLVLMRHSAVR